MKEADELREWIYQQAAAIDGEWGCCHSTEEIKAGRCSEMTDYVSHPLALVAALGGE